MTEDRNAPPTADTLTAGWHETFAAHLLEDGDPVSVAAAAAHAQLATSMRLAEITQAIRSSTVQSITLRAEALRGIVHHGAGGPTPPPAIMGAGGA